MISPLRNKGLERKIKLVITGASGLLGRALVRIIGEHHEVIGTGLSRARPPLYRLDLQDPHAVSAFIAQQQPDLVIHAAAERSPDRCENDHAHTMQMNCTLVRQLAEACKKQGCELIFISTDYVFDGKAPPYDEGSLVNPLNFYGHSKAAAESMLQQAYPEFSILRIPVLYGPVEYLGESAITVLAEQLMQNPTTPLDDWAVRYPTHVDDIALMVADIIERIPRHERGGIYHLSGDQPMTKYGMAQIIAPLLNRAINGKTLVPLSEPVGAANRPQNCALKDTRLAEYAIRRGRDFTAAIETVLRPHL